TKKDYDKARSYFDALHPMTQGIEYAALGSMYVEGKGVREDGAKARENYRQSALLGLPRGMALYASLLGTQNGGAIDYPDAFFWHYVAGELGDNYSRVMLYRPRVPEAPAAGEVGRDAQTALTWIEAVHSGKNMKNEPIYKEGFLKSLKSREQAAEQGDDWSRFYLGGMNYNGDFLNQNYARALYYYEPIAQNGKLPRPLLAMVHEHLAKMYREGKGTKADAAKAARHARIAAQYGSLPAYKIVENIAQ
ncbi:MAG: sel1 repeat family protein, partial [Muribaculum sp.]|nr:sel1 repeat family protein [Muribaculum sp.]